MKFYKVIAKCGHVKKGRYILKAFYVKAENGREAAVKVRWYSRVKHHHKDAIKEVKQINENEYRSGLIKQNADSYFHCSSKQEQNKLHAVDTKEILYEAQRVTYKRHHHGQYLKSKIREDEFNKLKRGGFYDYSIK